MNTIINDHASWHFQCPHVALNSSRFRAKLLFKFKFASSSLKATAEFASRAFKFHAEISKFNLCYQFCLLSSRQLADEIADSIWDRHFFFFILSLWKLKLNRSIVYHWYNLVRARGMVQHQSLFTTTSSRFIIRTLRTFFVSLVNFYARRVLLRNHAVTWLFQLADEFHVNYHILRTDRKSQFRPTWYRDPTLTTSPALLMKSEQNQSVKTRDVRSGFSFHIL